ncbi:MAG: hypothetical protein AMJ94_14745 [Deltaproteobacteria bacterium SM23_61]|nr:MAG: hypothetical protein AMJ94_14745 [Deltaproteobacteria bacterium SM23_61]
MPLRISVDNGGTFTDGILLNEKGETVTAKAHTTPEDITLGTMECMNRLARSSGMTLMDLLGRTGTIVLGTTLATNIVATRSGAKVGTITTKGYRDRLSFLHVAKADLGGDKKATSAELFSFRSEYPKPLTRRYLMTEVEERVNFRGEVLTPLNEEDVRRSVKTLKEQEVDAIAVMLLFSHLHPAHEQRIGEIIREDFPEAYVSLSLDVLPVMGEVSRWSTTMFSAYVAPKVIAYVSQIKKWLETEGFGGGLLFMQSNGGTATAEVVCENPAALLLSGPAAGPSLGRHIAGLHGIENVVTADMGGTSFDVSLIPEGQINVTRKKVIDGKKFGLFTVDVNAVGAGGGSIAWIDRLTGRLDVGPQSAGAFPGPACYGNGGTEPTITDANVVLGYIDPDYFLGGETRLRKDLAEKAIQGKIADPLGLTVPEAAAAIYDVVNAKMAGAIDVVFSKRGYDPRDFTLCAAGGALPVHAARLVEELRIKDFIVPKVAPVFCAFGMLYADIRHHFTRPYYREAGCAEPEEMDALFEEMQKEALDTFQKEGIGNRHIIIEKSMDICYTGQRRELTATAPDGPMTSESLERTIELFHERHGKIIGYSDPGFPVEIVRLHLAGISRVSPPRPREIVRGNQEASQALKGTRKAYFKDFNDYTDTAVYDGDRLLAGNRCEGPCIIEEKMTTLVVPPGIAIRVDQTGNYTTIMEA